MDRTKIAKRLVHLRGAKERKTVANDLNISLSTLRMYECGHRVPTDELKEKIAQYYGGRVGEIFYGE